MPAYNEAGNIAAAIEEVTARVFDVVPDSELIVIDDGSRDETAAISGGASECDPRVRVIRQANSGHGPALVNGIRAARGERLLLLDSDRQIGLERFAETWRLGAEHDAVLGVRAQRFDPRHRRLLSAMLRLAMRLALRVDAADPNAPYKLLARAQALRAIETMPPTPRIPSILLVVHLHRSRARIVEQLVRHAPRTAGRSTLDLRRLARFCAGALRELLSYDRKLRGSG
jgi:glycosyltransferase involved in cell wall biosynthesis